jgi:hypothetical protein
MITAVMPTTAPDHRDHDVAKQRIGDRRGDLVDDPIHAHRFGGREHGEAGPLQIWQADQQEQGQEHERDDAEHRADQRPRDP